MPQIHRAARRCAFQALFEAEFGHATARATLARALTERPLPVPEQAYARALVEGVVAHQAALDADIHAAAPQWPVADLAAVDRTVLRIALYELVVNNAAVPSSAVINEAVELAKTYGTDASRRFVNGVLGTVSRRQAVPAAIPPPASPPTETEEPRMALFERVRTIIEDQLGVAADEITPEASFVDDLGADSLDLVELIMSFEDTFKDAVPDLEITDEDAEGIGTVQNALDFLRSKGVPD